ncbi:uncharacterized protein LOC116432320 isoform X1 [Nomia melanderi]|uniref:uncharacterized protein LOC116432320 isoform X1 n=1 Tax=Nomia melanderi TaxID=2448451 RepID=UPI003FCCE7CF
MSRYFVFLLLISLIVDSSVTSETKSADRKGDSTFDYQEEDTTKETKLEEHGSEEQNPKKMNSTEAIEDSSQGNHLEPFHSHHFDDHNCPVNEVWAKCGRVCEQTCRRRGICLVKLCSNDWSGCRCKPGLLRNGKGQCVLHKYCKKCKKPKHRSNV